MILMVALFQMNMWTGVFVSLYFKAAVAVDREVTASLTAKAAARRKKWPKREDLPSLPTEMDTNKDWFVDLRHGFSCRLCLYIYGYNTHARTPTHTTHTTHTHTHTHKLT